MKKDSGLTSRTSLKPNLCCKLAPHLKCPRCDWGMCKTCIALQVEAEARSPYATRLQGAPTFLFGWHPICKCEKCKEDTHWSDANAGLFNWRGDPVYMCTSCLDKKRVPAEEFEKALREQKW